MDIKKAEHIHFSGIKGVGMTALALYTQDRGSRISGSDVSEEFVTQEVLRKRRVPIFAGFVGTNLQKTVDYLIYSGARPQNPEIKEAEQRGIPAQSYAQALAEIVDDKNVIATCGVGGKTTTAAMLTTILEKTGRKPSFIVGVGNIPGLGVPGRYAQGKEVVVEADDYATMPGIDNTPKFLYLNPMIIIVTNIEFDHPDVYRNLEETKQAFIAFFRRLPRGGTLIGNVDNPHIQQVFASFSQEGREVEVIPYGFSPQASWRMQQLRMGGRKTEVTVTVSGVNFRLRLNVPGRFNAANATAALIAATQLGVSQKDAIEALSGYQGTTRRFERMGMRAGVEVWDDYAHHPKEISETLLAARKWFPDKRVVAVFQPHTYTRTRALLGEFAKALSLADEIIVTDIYSSARETEDPTISGQKLAQATVSYNPRTTFVKRNAMLEYLKRKTKEGDVVMTLGAGDIYKIGRALIQEAKEHQA